MKEIKIVTMEHEDDIYYIPMIDGVKQSIMFEKEYEAIIYAGLAVSGISKNDCSYFSKYINHSLCSLIKDK